jgi:hypothetical protein
VDLLDRLTSGGGAGFDGRHQATTPPGRASTKPKARS